MWCLAVKQPWASLAVHGATRYLARGWSTSYRGPLGIHAAAQMSRAQVELCCDPEMRPYLRHCGNDFAMELPRAALIGVVHLVDCVYVTSCGELDACDPAVIFGLARPGRWAWHCTNPKVLDRPIPLRGRLGVFHVPDEFVATDSSLTLSLSAPHGRPSAACVLLPTTSDTRCQRVDAIPCPSALAAPVSPS
jgi:hypothetical protein